VHESYYHNESTTKYESESASKGFIAALVGIAVTKYGLDLDKPLAEYNVTPRADWGPYWPRITTRHILAQTTGLGHAAPATTFSYDSYDYIQHLSYLLAQITGRDPVEWATEELAVPLGIPDLFKHDSCGRDIVAGGGQPLTCRELARIGQLMLNKGAWPTEDGHPVQLVSEGYMREMVTPQYPNVSVSYGLLNWLNTHPAKPGGDACCAPRACTQESFGYKLWSTYGILGDDVEPIGAPPDMAMAMGWLSKWLFVIPERNMTVVTLGNTWGRSRWCDNDTTFYNFDEGWTSSLIWNAFSNLTIPQAAGEGRDNPAETVPSASTGAVSGTSRVAKVAGPFRDRPGAAPQQVVEQWGVCRCYCPPNMGFGHCFDMGKGTAPMECSTVLNTARNVCVSVGLVTDCRSQAVNHTWVGDGMSCRVTQPCPSDAPPFASQLGMCDPVQFYKCDAQMGVTCDTESPRKIYGDRIILEPNACSATSTSTDNSEQV